MNSSPTIYASKQKQWYRRPILIIPVMLLAIAVMVISDYPKSVSKADLQSQYSLIQKEIWTDMQSCSASITDSTTAVTEIVNKITNQMATAQSIVKNAIPNCTIVGNGDLLDMESIEVPNILLNYKVNTIISDLYTWAFPNAKAVLDDLAQLLTDPTNQALKSDILSHQRIMDALYSKAQALMNSNSAKFGIPTQNLNLPTINSLPSSIFG
ncbi:MAG: hypothetical protein M0Z45_09180 [Actinomycetota bacterium]|nr:hypothetical protein [Actinomycetota bacterium]